MPDHDPYHLSRFVSAQEKVYESVLSELRSGLKITHWMWFIFPQMEGLGYSSISSYFSIKSGEEARRYLTILFLDPGCMNARKRYWRSPPRPPGKCLDLPMT